MYDEINEERGDSFNERRTVTIIISGESGD